MKKIKLKIPTEIYSRVVGYFRPVQNWNEGKKREFKERENYNIENLKGEDNDEN